MFSSLDPTILMVSCKTMEESDIRNSKNSERGGLDLIALPEYFDSIGLLDTMDIYGTVDSILRDVWFDASFARDDIPHNAPPSYIAFIYFFERKIRCKY